MKKNAVTRYFNLPLSSLVLLTRITLLVLVFSIISFDAGAQRSITLPRDPSPAASVSQTIGITDLSVNYSRPSVRGREVWGKLVPYGWFADSSYGNRKKAPWRAGANENTVFTLPNDALIGGKPVPAGKYGMFFIINADNSGELVLSKTSDSWGSFWYDESQDALRVPIKIRDTADVETLVYSFNAVTPVSTELDLCWAKKIFPVNIVLDAKSIVLANAATELRGMTGFTWQGYLSAARYALIYTVATPQTLGWADTAVAGNASFTTLGTKAGLLGLMGKTEEHDALMKQAMTLATDAELNNYGYQLIAAQKFDEAINVFETNTKMHPKNPNVWDSLGEAYADKGDKQKAIASFKKSLSLNPPANVRANSEKFLRQLETK